MEVAKIAQLFLTLLPMLVLPIAHTKSTAPTISQENVQEVLAITVSALRAMSWCLLCIILGGSVFLTCTTLRQLCTI